MAEKKEQKNLNEENENLNEVNEENVNLGEVTEDKINKAEVTEENENLNNVTNKKKLSENEEQKIKQKFKDDLEKLVSEVEEKFGIDRSQIKFVKRTPKQRLLYQIIQILFQVIINIVLIMSLTGLIRWASYNSVWDILIFASIFSVFEIGLKYLLTAIFKRHMISMMVLIVTLPTLIAIPLSIVINESLVITSIVMSSVPFVLLMFALFIFIRVLFNSFLVNRFRKRRMNLK